MQQIRRAPASEDVNNATQLLLHAYMHDSLQSDSTNDDLWMQKAPEECEVVVKTEPVVEALPPSSTVVPKISTLCLQCNCLPFETKAPALDSVPSAPSNSTIQTYDTDLRSSMTDTDPVPPLNPQHVPLDVVSTNDILVELQDGTKKDASNGDDVQAQPPVALLQHPPLSIDKAVDFLNPLSCLTSDEYDDVELHGNFKHMMHMLIPSNATAALLERRGQPIQSIGQQSNCTLFIRDRETSPFKEDRLLCLQGTAKCISLAQRLVIAYIRAFRAKKGDPNYMELPNGSSNVPLVAVTSISKAMDVAMALKKKNEVTITNPFVWMVQREDVGKMMGKQGSVLQSIRRDTGASIRIEDEVVPGTTERRVVLSGAVKSITAAVEKIRKRAGGRSEVAASATNGRLGRYFAIPYHSAGCLIGPQGSTIKTITERTGARLQAPSTADLPLGSLNRILHIQGTPKQTEHARRVVSAKLRDYLATSTSPQTMSTVSTGAKGDRVTVKVLLPSRICGFMLAGRGKLIREISDKSGAHTHFLAARDGDGNRVCVFTGDMSCVLRAQRLVLQFIAGDVISSKQVGSRRKRKRFQGGEEKDGDHDEVKEEYVGKGELCHDDEVYRESCFDDALRLAQLPPVPQKHARRQPFRHARHDCVKGEEELYVYDDGMVCMEHHLQQPIHQRPVVICPCETSEDDYAVGEYNHNEYGRDDRVLYVEPRPQGSTRLAIVRRQPADRHEHEYDDSCEEYANEHGLSDDDEDVLEAVIVGKQERKRRPSSSRPKKPRPSMACPGRKVQMIVTVPSSRQERPRRSLTSSGHTTGAGVVCLRDSRRRARPSNVSRSGKGCARPGTKQGGRTNNNKRRC
uniref:K Homology domain-containing protein n=1 Tax=Hyaloperonospora arabidopsidis (strain Emoy2) TaxID=559515 RepID=M4BKA0_HYAAE